MKDYARLISERLPSDVDCIFSPSSMPISYLSTDKPIYFYTDSTFNEMIGYYPSYVNLCSETLKDGFNTEKLALNNSTLAFYASEWAAKSAVKNYDINEDKIKVVPFGANLLESPSFEKIKENIQNRSRLECNLLFIGVDFVRKGGLKAYEVTKKLNANGVKSKLHIVGIENLPKEFDVDFVKNYGFLNKSDSNQKHVLENLLTQSHFLIVPSLAEAYGLVYCEANAYGLPSIGTNTGGVPTVIRDGINGWVLQQDNFVDETFIRIKKTFESFETYKTIALNSFKEFDARLNWKVSGRKIIDYIKASKDK